MGEENLGTAAEGSESGSGGAGEGQGDAGAGGNTDPSTASATPAAEGASKEETFLGSEEIPKKGDPNWEPYKRMQASYTRKMQGIAETNKKAAEYDRFNNDADFRREVVLNVTRQMGLSGAGQPQAQNPTQQPNAGQVQSQLPPGMVEAVAARLSPEMKWMAPEMAQAQWVASQYANQPRDKAEAQKVRADRESQLATTGDDLNEKFPGWQTHEDDMKEYLSFLRSDQISHKRWGSKLEIALRAVTGNSSAVAEAAQRMNTASDNKGQLSNASSTGSVSNIAERVLKAPNNHEAWKVAKEIADEELKKQGVIQ